MSKIKQWVKLSNELKQIKKDEMSLRRDICGDILRDLPLPATKEAVLDGIKFKASNTVTRNLDAEALNQVFTELSDEDKAALKYEPKLVMKFYKKLPETSLLHIAVTEKPSAPTLKVLK